MSAEARRERLGAPAAFGKFDGTSWAPESSRLTRAVTSTAFLGVSIAMLTWPIRSAAPSTGIDPSWVAALYMAVDGGLQFGRELVFTYGPLGFLQQPVLYDQNLWMLAFIYGALVQIALAVSLLWIARRALPLAVAVVLCYLVLVIGTLEGAAVLLALIWCSAALADSPPPFTVRLVVVGGGVLSAVELLGKANFGLAVLAICTITVLALRGRRRNVPLFAGIAFGTASVLWLAVGQSPSNAPDFVSASLQVLSGYSSAMNVDVTSTTWELPGGVAAAALLLIGSVAAGWRHPMPRRLALIAIYAVFALFAFKQGFVRQGLGNTPNYFALVLGAGVSVGSLLAARPSGTAARAAALALVATSVALAGAALPGSSPWRALEPGDHMAFLRQDLDLLFEPEERARLVSSSRAEMRSAYRLEARTLGLIGDRSVHIDPWETSVAWAYELNWRPLPVFQSYVAYTPELDALNVDALSGPAAPELILRRNTEQVPAGGASVDGRYAGWDPPAASLAMLCNYRAVSTTRRWQLLERSSDRCDGPARPLGVVEGRTGEPIVVPRPPTDRDAVFARIAGLEVDGLERLRTLLYRARERTVTLDGGPPSRLAPATAGDGLIMAAPEGIDFPRPYALAPNGRTMVVEVRGAGSRKFEVNFFAQRLGPASRSRAGHPLRHSTARRKRSIDGV